MTFNRACDRLCLCTRRAIYAFNWIWCVFQIFVTRGSAICLR